MEEQQKKTSWKIWLLMSPLYVLLAIPVVKFAMRNNSSDINLEKDEYKAFNLDAEVKKPKLPGYQPNLAEAGYSVNYNAVDAETQEEIDWGAKEGYLTNVLAQNLNDYTLLTELYNNKWMIQGFMARKSVQQYLFSTDNLKKLFSDKKAVRKFLSEPAINNLLENPKAMKIILDSNFTKTILDDKVCQEFMKDSKAIEQLLTKDRTLVRVIKIPAIKKFIVSSTQTQHLAEAVGWK